MRRPLGRTGHPGPPAGKIGDPLPTSVNGGQSVASATVFSAAHARPRECGMQTPAPVDYERATSVEHALALLEQRGEDARLIAGGHSLLPMMRLRLAQPECV